MITISHYPSGVCSTSSVIELDLTQYIKSIEQKIVSPTPEHIEKYEEFYQMFLQLVQPIVGDLHWMSLVSKAMEGSELSEETIEQLKQSPAYRILADTLMLEILKNSMDECLFAYFDPHHMDKLMRVRLVMTIHIEDEQFCFEFRDSGRGFPDSFLSRVRDNALKAVYLCQSDSHQHKQDSALLFKSFGGHGIGLRDLIGSVHCGQHYSLLKSKVIADNPQNAPKIIEAGMATNYRVEFSNQSGACIRVITPRTEHQLRDKCIVLSEGKQVDPEFRLKMPNFKLLQKSSMWQRPLEHSIDKSVPSEMIKAQ